MRRRFLALASLLCGCSALPKQGEPERTVVGVVYEIDSGPILPERQWVQRFEVTADGVLLTRRGRVSATRVNEGSWPVPSDEPSRIRLLSRLAAVTCADLRRIEPSETPDGGRTESVSVVYPDGSSCSLTLEPGVTYEGGEVLVGPVREYLAGLRLPSEAVPELRSD